MSESPFGKKHFDTQSLASRADIKAVVEGFVCAYVPASDMRSQFVRDILQQLADSSELDVTESPIAQVLAISRLVLRQHGWFSVGLATNQHVQKNDVDKDKLESLFAGLSEQQRTAFIQRFHLGLSREDVATRLDTHLDVVKQHLVCVLIDLAFVTREENSFPLQSDVLTQAADWYERQPHLQHDAQQAFARWFTIKAHQDAFHSIAQAASHVEVSRVLAQFAQLPVNETQTSHNQTASPVLNQPKRIPWVASAITIAIIGGLTWIFLTTQLASYHLSPPAYNEEPDMMQKGSYITAVGSRGSYVLKDGSVIYMNGDSKIDVDSNPQQRVARLIAGRVYFAVVYEPARPFLVQIGSTTADISDAAVDVDLLGDELIISVYEGVVKLKTPEVRTLTKGQGVVIANNAIESDFFVVNQLPSWRSGWLEVKGSSLGDVILEFQRYSRKPIRLDGPDNRIITGRFYLDTPSKSLLAIATSVGAQFIENEHAITICVPPSSCSQLPNTLN